MQQLLSPNRRGSFLPHNHLRRVDEVWYSEVFAHKAVEVALQMGLVLPVRAELEELLDLGGGRARLHRGLREFLRIPIGITWNSYLSIYLSVYYLSIYQSIELL